MILKKSFALLKNCIQMRQITLIDPNFGLKKSLDALVKFYFSWFHLLFVIVDTDVRFDKKVVCYISFSFFLSSAEAR